MKPKAMTLRLDQSTADELELLARADGVSVASEVRSAIEGRIAERRADADFMASVKRIIEQDKAILDRLSR